MSFYKPDSLKQALTTALDGEHHISDNPDRLQIEILEGTVHALATPGFGFRYAYEIAVGVLDFSGELNEIMIPLLLWLERWEPEYLLSHAQAQRGIRFERQPLNDEAANIMFSLKLTETVGFELREDGGFNAVHRRSPPIANTGPAAPFSRLFANGVEVGQCSKPLVGN